MLFYLEMAALTGELTAALSGSIKKASQKALENTAEVNKIIKQAQETLLKNTDEAGNPKQIEEVLKAQDDLAAIKQLEEFAGVAENLGGSGFRTLSKKSDAFGKLKQVSKYENEIRKLDYEDAKFFDEEGTVLSESFSQKSKNSVSFGDKELNKIIEKAGNNPRKVILSHNHPTSTGISADDIKIVFDLQFAGIRAIAQDGSNYFVKKTGNMSNVDFYKTTSDVAKKVRTENPDIIKKAMLDRNSNESKQLAQLLVDGLIEELVKLKEIEYTKYQ